MLIYLIVSKTSETTIFCTKKKKNSGFCLEVDFKIIASILRVKYGILKAFKVESR